jgi:hypothetical protein
VRGKVKRTTISDRRTPKPLDLVNRNFRPHAPDRLWVADFKCRRRHLKSYADLRTMPTSSGDGRRHQVVGVERSA